MNMHHLFLAMAAAASLMACNKENTPSGGGEQGGGGSSQKNTPAIVLHQDFTKGLGDFTIVDKDKGGFTKAIWKYETGDNAKYGAQASASEGSGGASYKAESWLVSPLIDLTNYTDANLYFDHAFAYVTSGAPKDYFSIKVSEDGGTTWKDRELPKWLVSHSYFELAQSGNISLSAFKGKKIKFAFVYTSTSEVAPTWEINIGTSMEVWKSFDFSQPVTQSATLRAHWVSNAMREARLSYNKEGMVANWVAYPLYDQFAKSRVKRYDNIVSTNQAWQSDPFVKTTDVSTGGSYKWSTYAPGVVLSRGHQIPSADRLGGAMVNMQTFYTSNVTPQESKFNGSIWGNLETAVRNWSSSGNSTDSLYVVTGCIVDNTCEKVSDHNGTMVSIPKAYYKAVLRLSKGEYIGAGFYMEHEIHPDGNNKIASGNIKDYAMSLKDLEAKTGMTFFVNLPAEKASVVKAQNPKDVPFWNLK